MMSKNQKIAREMHRLYALSASQVRDVIGRSHRVSDLKGVSKDELISMALEDQFGRNAMIAYNA